MSREVLNKNLAQMLKGGVDSSWGNEKGSGRQKIMLIELVKKDMLDSMWDGPYRIGVNPCPQF